MVRWPNLFIVGAERSGTTSLYRYLQQIPSIYMSPVKEPRYFNGPQLEPWLHRIDDRERYLALFEQGASLPVLGEASPSYLRDPGAASRIRAAAPTARTVIILRDPVERAFSHYLLHRSTGHESRELSQVLSAFRHANAGSPDCSVALLGGFYCEAVRRFLDTFDPSQVLVLRFGRLCENPAATTGLVSEFLGVECDVESMDFRVHNRLGAGRGAASRALLRSGKVRMLGRLIPENWRWFARSLVAGGNNPRPQLKAEDRAALQSLYHADALELERLLGASFRWRWSAPAAANRESPAT